MLFAKCHPFQSGLSGFHSFAAEIFGMFCANKVNTIAADAMDPYVARPSNIHSDR